jgi:hypothetical protein
MTSPHITVKLDLSRAMDVLVGIAGLLAVFGAFLPWVTLSAPFIGTISKNGVDGDGVYTIGLGAALLIYAIIRIGAFRLHASIAAVLAVGLLGLAVVDFVDVYRAAADLRSIVSNQSDGLGIGAAIAQATSISAGIGLWLEIFAALMALVGAALTVAFARRTAVARAHQPFPVSGYMSFDQSAHSGAAPAAGGFAGPVQGQRSA